MIIVIIRHSWFFSQAPQLISLCVVCHFSPSIVSTLVLLENGYRLLSVVDILMSYSVVRLMVKKGMTNDKSWR